MTNDSRTWLITGISRGLGREIARAALDRGDLVIGTSRSGEADLGDTSGRLHVLPLDQADPQQPADVVARALDLSGGRLDVLVNNAGYGLMGSVEAAHDDEISHVFAANLFGPLRIIRAALPTLRGQRSGHVVNVSSIAAIAPQRGSGVYASAKAGLNAVSEALAQELAPFGVHVTVVEPGAFRTDFLSPTSIRSTGTVLGEYAESANAGVDRMMRTAGTQPGDPAVAGRVIAGLVDLDSPPLHLLLGSDAWERTRAVLDRWQRDLSAWEETTRSTDFLTV